MSVESPKPECKTKSYRRNALALGLVAGAALGIAMEREDVPREPTEMRPSNSITPQEHYVPLDSKGTVANEPRETVIIPRTQPELLESDWLEPLPPETCVVSDVTLATGPTEQEIAAVSKIEMGLSIHEYKDIQRSLEASASMDEVRSIVKNVYRRYGIETTFNQTEENLVVEPVRTEPSPSEALIPEHRIFASKMSNQLSALLYMPREMAELPDTLNIIDGGILSYIKDGFKEPINGMYKTDGSRGVVLSSAAGKRVLVHEWGHALHDTACRNESGFFVDREMEKAYDTALEILKADTASGGSKPERDQKKAKMLEDTARFRDEKGFPSEYSLTNYLELMAELTEHILLEGQSSTYDGEPSPQAIKLDEMVVERMQMALPELDIKALVVARSYYSQDVPLQELLDHRVSPLDMTYETVQDIDGDMVITPAVDVLVRGGTRAEHIYARLEKVTKTLKGIQGGAYTINFKKPGDPQSQEQLVAASLRYLQQAVRREGVTADFHVREFDDSFNIIGSYIKDGLSDQAPKVRRTAYTKE